jgi:hypothetical protein
MLAPRERRALEHNSSNALICTDIPLNVCVQWYIGQLECIDFGAPRNMPPVLLQQCTDDEERPLAREAPSWAQ